VHRSTVDAAGENLFGFLVKPAPPDLPFRWLITVDDRERPALSIVAVLRQVRETSAPEERPRSAPAASRSRDRA